MGAVGGSVPSVPGGGVGGPVGSMPGIAGGAGYIASASAPGGGGGGGGGAAGSAAGSKNANLSALQEIEESYNKRLDLDVAQLMESFGDIIKVASSSNIHQDWVT
ncbi:hypothetical protein EDD11_008100 [Mortierella claussenii]|nr:hypothetical protein EDD11_008100 [Mortierella claussenii]